MRTTRGRSSTTSTPQCNDECVTALSVYYYWSNRSMEVSLVPEQHVMQVYGGMELIFHLLYCPCHRWKWVMIFTLRPPYFLRNKPRCPLDRRLFGPKTWSGHCTVKKGNHCICRKSNPGRPPLLPSHCNSSENSTHMSMRLN